MEEYIKQVFADLNIVNSELESAMMRITETDYSESIKLILRFVEKMMDCDKCSTDSEFSKFVELQYRTANFLATAQGVKHYRE